jgi:Domain of unknown function (DUF5615)
MTTLPFLLDEDVPEYRADEIIRLEPGITTFQVGLDGGPPKGTKDPPLLAFAQENKMILVSMDKSTMPNHLRTHFAQGRHTCGVLLLRQGFPITDYTDDLILVWPSCEDRDLIDCTMYIPLQ